MRVHCTWDQVWTPEVLHMYLETRGRAPVQHNLLAPTSQVAFEPLVHFVSSIDLTKSFPLLIPILLSTTWYWRQHFQNNC